MASYIYTLVVIQAVRDEMKSKLHFHERNEKEYVVD